MNEMKALRNPDWNKLKLRKIPIGDSMEEKKFSEISMKRGGINLIIQIPIVKETDTKTKEEVKEILASALREQVTDAS